MRNNYLWYQFFRYGVVGPALRLFHSEVTVCGVEKIPDDKPLIFVVNHQNALMDALHVVTSTKKFVHFLTRAEPFEMPVLRHFFRSLNMMPVYRVRDGFGNIRKNHQTFGQCYRRLEQGDAVLAFAEANHDLRRRVRPLSKGFTRIAFGAEQRNNWELGVQVQPVGLNYGRHRKARSPVHVQFGKSIPVGEYEEAFRQDEQATARRLTADTARALKELTMHVPTLEAYPFYDLLLDRLEPDRQKLLKPDVANKRVALAKSRITDKILAKAEKLGATADQEGVQLQDFVSSSKFTRYELLMSPLYLFSLLNNALPYQLIRWTTTGYIEDHVFDATAKFLLGLFGLPVYYLVIAALLGFAGLSWPWIGGYFLVSVLTAPLFVRAKDLLADDAAPQLKQEQPEVYQSIKNRMAEFEELRQQLF